MKKELSTIVSILSFEIEGKNYQTLEQWLREKPTLSYNYPVFVIDDSGNELEFYYNDPNLDLANLTIQFSNYAEKYKKVQISKKAKHCFNKLVEARTAGIDLEFFFIKDNDYYYNRGTRNLNSVSGHDFGICVYGDLINDGANNGQIDSRTHTDTQIIRAIRKYLLDGAELRLSHRF